MMLFKRSARGLFASESLVAHLVRGGVAIALLAWAVTHEGSHPAFALSAGIAAMVAFRGCPICWGVGLVETIAQKLRR